MGGGVNYIGNMNSISNARRSNTAPKDKLKEMKNTKKSILNYLAMAPVDKLCLFQDKLKKKTNKLQLIIYFKNILIILLTP